MDQIYIGKQSTIRLDVRRISNYTSYVRRIIRYLKNKCPVQCVFSTDSSNISAAISMMHHCEEEEGGCHFVETDVCQLVERQETIQHKLTFQHDWTNTLYCRNLYCV